MICIKKLLNKCKKFILSPVKASFNLKEISPCLFAVLVDILGFSLAIPILTALFTSGDFFPASTSDTVRFAYLAAGFMLYPAFMFFGSSFMGDLSDIIGRKKVLLLCMGGFTFGFILMGLGASAHHLFLLFLGRALTGLTAASLPVTMAAIADLSTPSNKAAHMSFVVIVQGAGIVLGPLMAAFLSNSDFVSFFTDATPFYSAAGLALIAFLWIHTFFSESFERQIGKKLHPFRVILVFIEAAKHPRIRILTSAFLLHQVGIGLYLQLILIFLSQKFQYTSFGIGIFNAFLGLWIALGALFVGPLAKRFRIEWIACSMVALLGLSEFFASLIRPEVLIWINALFVGGFGNIAWSAILTSFSEAVDSNSQGWALGITGAVVALSFMLTGFSPNLIPYFGTLPLIGFGGVCTLVGSLILFYYCRKKLDT